MPIRLDERLSKIASLISGGTVADVGCDHGKLAYYLVSTDRASKAIATDISEGSLKKARELASENGADELVITRLGDGLAPIASGEVDAVVIAGLGGDVISKILLDAHREGKRFQSYVLSPNTHPEKARRALSEIGQKITYDSAVECAGKLYTVIASREGQGALDELEETFGAFYLRDAQFEKRAAQELKYIASLIGGGASSDKLARRKKLLETALENIKKER